MSNRYYNDWKATNSRKTHKNNPKPNSSESSHLDRTLDKIKTNEKAEKIFDRGHNLYSSPYLFSSSNQVPYYPQVVEAQILTQTPTGFSHSHFPYSQPVLLTPIGKKYILINGCVVISQK